MNKYVKEFIHRGLIFGGLGPIVLAVIYTIIHFSDSNFSLTGVQTATAIISIYCLAFIQAGASVFNQIESFSLPKSLLCHLSCLYVIYVICYLINNWIPFNPTILLIFTAIFLAVYFITWITVFTIVKITSKKLNGKLNQQP